MHDLIVIGAGSSGSVIAARASENPNLQVLLVEAGPDYEHLEDTPADLINSHNNSFSSLSVAIVLRNSYLHFFIAFLWNKSP